MRERGSSHARGPALTATVLALSLALPPGCASTPGPPRAARLPHPPRAAARNPDPTPSPPVRAVLERQVRVRSGVVTLLAADGALWVSGFGQVSRIDPATGRLLARIATPRAGDMTAVATGYGSVWVTGNYEASVVYRIDTATNRVAAIIRAPGPALGIVAGAGRVWLAVVRKGPGVIVRIDPKTDRITGPPIQVGPGPDELTYGEGSVWVQNSAPASVMRIDPATGRAATVMGPAAVDYGSPAVGAVAVAVGFGSLWATANGYLTRYNPGTDQVIADLRDAHGAPARPHQPLARPPSALITAWLTPPAATSASPRWRAEG